ncbi:MAG: type II toxin-antitoxin system RelE/ParE family toxin [Proteobacteria bacterium]|nr:type II toxin-antitoxin system RelE/ParE family toxin [Pseudomonadota bacterium]
MWQIIWHDHALKKLKKFPRVVRERALRYMEERVLKANHPRDFGHGLVGDKTGFWRYRIGDYRLICRINETEKTIEIRDLGHRKDIYD